MRRLVIPILFVLATPFALAGDDPASAIRLNTVGFLPDAPKRATIAAKAGTFSVVDAASGEKVLEQPLAAGTRDDDTKETVTVADFSAVTRPGKYRLVVAGLDETAEFTVAPDVYRDTFRTVVRGMYLWRCGTHVRGEHEGDVFENNACHLEDAWMDYVNGEHERRDGTGGWHDAGDHNKYIVNAAVTVGSMLRAWDEFRPAVGAVALDLPEKGGPIPEFLAEIKWETDWFFKMQAPDGSVYHKLSTLNFGGMILPQDETTPRYFTPWSSGATAGFVAVMARMARAIEPYDKAYAARCLQAALKSHGFLTTHPSDQPAEMPKFRTGAYTSPDPDDRLWAVAELWETTGEEKYLGELEARIRFQGTSFDEDFGWGKVKNLGLLVYLQSEKPGRDAQMVADVRRDLLDMADKIVATAGRGGYGRPLGSIHYWGCHGGVATQTLLLQAAHRLTGEARYRETALQAVDHLLGRNYFGRSMVTGVGRNPPLFPHDRRSAGDKVAAPWPGYLVGGPEKGARDWEDKESNFRVNETAINWNGALIYALAGFLPAP